MFGVSRKGKERGEAFRILSSLVHPQPVTSLYSPAVRGAADNMVGGSDPSGRPPEQTWGLFRFRKCGLFKWERDGMLKVSRWPNGWFGRHHPPPPFWPVPRRIFPLPRKRQARGLGERPCYHGEKSMPSFSTASSNPPGTSPQSRRTLRGQLCPLPMTRQCREVFGVSCSYWDCPLRSLLPAHLWPADPGWTKLFIHVVISQ